MIYYKFVTKYMTSLSRMDALKYKNKGSVPGNAFDKKKGVKRFDKWYKLPKTAYKLYWRFH